MLLFTHRVFILIVRILHCHTWTENIMERERILPHTEILVKGNGWFSTQRINIIIHHWWDIVDLWSRVNSFHITVPTIDWMKSHTQSEEGDNSLDNSIGITAAFSNGLEGKLNTSRGDSWAKAFTRIKHQENLHWEKHLKHHSKGNIHHWQKQHFGKRSLNVHPS